MTTSPRKTFVNGEKYIGWRSCIRLRNVSCEQGRTLPHPRAGSFYTLSHDHACSGSAAISVGLAFTPSTNETYGQAVGGSRRPGEFCSCIRQSRLGRVPPGILR